MTAVWERQNLFMSWDYREECRQNFSPWSVTIKVTFTFSLTSVYELKTVTWILPAHPHRRRWTLPAAKPCHFIRPNVNVMDVGRCSALVVDYPGSVRIWHTEAALVRTKTCHTRLFVSDQDNIHFDQQQQRVPTTDNRGRPLTEAFPGNRSCHVGRTNGRPRLRRKVRDIENFGDHFVTK